MGAPAILSAAVVKRGSPSVRRVRQAGSATACGSRPPSTWRTPWAAPGPRSPAPPRPAGPGGPPGRPPSGVPERGPGDRRHLVPGAVPGGGRGRGDDLGVRVRLLDRRVAPLAAGHRDQELLRLDDLQVVIAQAVARTRLEPGVVAQDRAAEDGGVAPVGAAPAQAQPQLVHLLEVPRRGAVRTVDLEAERAFRADADPGRFQR